MKHGAWIVCERTGLWAAALRMQLSARNPVSNISSRMYEVRNSQALGDRLEELPASIAMLEVNRGNFADALEWLAAARDRFPRSRFAVLLDSRSFDNRSFDNRPAIDESVSDSQLVGDALREAGAVDVLRSPRAMHHLVELGRHFESSCQLAGLAAECQSIADWAWAALPWQDR